MTSLTGAALLLVWAKLLALQVSSNRPITGLLVVLNFAFLWGGLFLIFFGFAWNGFP